MAGQVHAQTATVITSGLSGSNACFGGYTQRQVAAFDSTRNQTSATNTNVNFSLANLVNWTNIKGLIGIGDGGANSYAIYGKVKNTLTGADVGSQISFGTISSTQQTANYGSNNVTLSEKTPYALIIYTDYSDRGENNPIAVQCFMTGGTYTTSTLSSGTSGCFSISPLTPHDVRNCLCGRSNLAQTATTKPTIQPGHTHDQARLRMGCR